MKKKNPLDQIAVLRFQTLIGTWDYPNPPSYYHQEWIKFTYGIGVPYWESRQYELQRESDKDMCKLIYDIYCRVSGLINIET